MHCHRVAAVYIGNNLKHNIDELLAKLDGAVIPAADFIQCGSQLLLGIVVATLNVCLDAAYQVALLVVALYLHVDVAVVDHKVQHRHA